MEEKKEAPCLFCAGQAGGKACRGLCRFWGAKPEGQAEGFDFGIGDHGYPGRPLVYRYGPNGKYKITIPPPGRKPLK